MASYSFLSKPHTSTKSSNFHKKALSIFVPSKSSKSSRMPCSPITNEPPKTATAPSSQAPHTVKRMCSFGVVPAFPFRSNKSAPQPRSPTARRGSDTPAPPSSKHTYPPSSGHHSSKSTSASKSSSKHKDYPVRDLSTYPTSFARDVALLQLMDGGSTAHNIRRVHRMRAKAAARAGVPYNGVEATVVGPNGEIWLDEHEEAEYKSLVRGTCVLDKNAAKAKHANKASVATSSTTLMNSEDSDLEDDEIATWRRPMQVENFPSHYPSSALPASSASLRHRAASHAAPHAQRIRA